MGKKLRSRLGPNKSEQSGLGDAKRFLWHRLNRRRASPPKARKSPAKLVFKVKNISVSWEYRTGLVSLQILSEGQVIYAPIHRYGAKESLAVELLRDRRFSKKPCWLNGGGTKEAILAALASLDPCRPLKFRPFPELYAAKRLLLEQLAKKPVVTLARIAAEDPKAWSELVSSMTETRNKKFLVSLGRHLKSPQPVLDPLDIRIARGKIEYPEATDPEIARLVRSNSESVRKRRKPMGL